MKILAIDTSSEICSVAILEDEKVIDEINLDNGLTHSENLMILIDQILNRNNLNIKNINLLACSVGPGSFTGIRIGISTIKPFAEILNIKVAAISSLETLARNVETKDKTIVSLIDARNDQIYCGIFNDNYNKKEDYFAKSINETVNHLKKYENIVFVGSGSEKYKELLEKEFQKVEFCQNNKQSAGNVGKMGFNNYMKDDLKTADTVFPIYLRKSQAERMKKN